MRRPAPAAPAPPAPSTHQHGGELSHVALKAVREALQVLQEGGHVRQLRQLRVGRGRRRRWPAAAAQALQAAQEGVHLGCGCCRCVCLWRLGRRLLLLLGVLRGARKAALQDVQVLGAKCLRRAADAYGRRRRPAGAAAGCSGGVGP